MEFSEEADKKAKTILKQNTSDLNELSISIASLRGADRVSDDFVDQAAALLTLRRPSPWADAMLSIGTAVSGAAAGVFATLVTATEEPTTVTLAVSVVALATGCVLAGAGFALKVKKAR